MTEQSNEEYLPLLLDPGGIGTMTALEDRQLAYEKAVKANMAQAQYLVNIVLMAQKKQSQALTKKQKEEAAQAKARERQDEVMHGNGKSKSKSDKHTARRSGGRYNDKQNNKRGKATKNLNLNQIQIRNSNEDTARKNRGSYFRLHGCGRMGKASRPFEK